VLDTLGYVHLQRGEGEKAVATLRRAVEGDPSAPSIRYRLGLALSRTGDSQGARVSFSEALEMGPFPESEDAKRELANLKTP